jgi:hypothetical protein
VNENLVGLAMFWLVLGQIVAYLIFESATASIVVVVVFITLIIASFVSGGKKL